ncbi:MAG: hypothetical protein ACM3TN_00140 [Alphaproteobacteria bacterium]
MESSSRSASPLSSPSLIRERSASILEDGILTGMMGAAVVAVWFFILDTTRGRMLFTPSLLGSVVFLGQSPDQVVSVNGSVMFAYTGLHVLLFLVAGLVIAWMFSLFEHHPHFGIMVLLLFFLFEAILFTFAAVIFPSLMGALGSLAVASGNLFAAISMFWFLIRRHPSAITQLRLAWHEE